MVLQKSSAQEVLSSYNQGKRDFQRLDLQGANFRGANLEGANFNGSNLRATDFTNAILIKADFSNFEAEQQENQSSENKNDTNITNFKQTNLQGANFRGANLKEAKFNGSDIYGADFTNAILVKADFSNAKAEQKKNLFSGFKKVQCINFSQDNLQGAKFIGATLQEAKFNGSDISGANFTDARLIKADFSDAKAELEKNQSSENQKFQCIFSQANLQESKFINANLKEAKFNGSDLHSTGFTNAILVKADFSNFEAEQQENQSSKNKNDTNIANFKRTNLQGANFRGANLEEAKFNGSDICGADFTDAILIKANFRKTKAGQIKNNKILTAANFYIELYLLFYLSLICQNIAIALLFWINDLSSKLDIQQEPEQLQYPILIFWISIVGFFTYLIVNHRQGIKASLISVALAPVAIVLVNLNQPVFLFIAWLLLLAELFIFCINFTAFVYNNLILILKDKLIIFNLFTVLIFVFYIFFVFDLHVKFLPYILYLIPLFFYFSLCIIKLPRWISSCVLAIIILISLKDISNYIVEELGYNFKFSFFTFITTSAVLSNIVIGLSIYKFSLLGLQKIYAIISSIIMVFLPIILTIISYDNELIYQLIKEDWLYSIVILIQENWLYSIVIFFIYFLALKQGVLAGWCTLEVDRRYIWIRKLSHLLSFNINIITSFHHADLTKAKFTEAELKNTDFTGANIKYVDWKEAKNLNLAYIEGTYLQSRKIRDLLVVEEKAEEKNAKR
jgi:uncharacterized protein YjbI with pentapeptide repeats